MSGSVAFARATAFGRLVGVALPAEDDLAAVEALAAALPDEERAHAATLAPVRRVTWVGGRVALHAALEELGAAAAPIASTPRGAPILPAGFAGSIAHKRALAVALAAPAAPDVTIGVDVEQDWTLRAPAVDITERVLTPAERARVETLAEPARATAVLRAFAAKEAIYKALDPWLGRYVGFREVELDGATARFVPRADEPAFTIELADEALPGYLLVTARVQRRAS